MIVVMVHELGKNTQNLESFQIKYSGDSVC